MTDNAQYFLISGGTGESKFKLIILMGSSFALPILVDSLKLQDMYRKQFEITHSKNTSSYTVKNIPDFWVFLKFNVTNQRQEVHNNRCSSNYSLSNWYSGVSRSCPKSNSTTIFMFS